MNIKSVYCFFEQSGTFKNAFKFLGISEAFDVDIKDDFGETTLKTDLFVEIEKAYNGEGHNLFNNITPDDLIIAFFPCTRFESQSRLLFRGESFSQGGWNDWRKVEYSLTLHEELAYLYKHFCMLVSVCLTRHLRLIIENPYSANSYLIQFFPIKPAVIERDRSLKGDYFVKPTAYWFIGCAPELNFILEPAYKSTSFNITELTTDDLEYLNCKDIKTARSMISPEYAVRFIKENILSKEVL